MTVLDLDQLEKLAEAESQFWPMLEATLEIVFESDPDLAQDYRRDLAGASPLQRALALHDEPLDVASTLTGKYPSPDRILIYNRLFGSYSRSKQALRRSVGRVLSKGDVLASTPRDDDAPMVPLRTLNRFMEELGYNPLQIKAGVASFTLGKKAWKRPLLKRYDMESLPGRNSDGADVYRLDRVITLFNALQEYSRRHNPASTIADRIEKVKARLVRSLNLDH